VFEFIGTLMLMGIIPVGFVLAPITVPYYLIKEKLEDNKKKKLAVREALRSTFRKIIYKEVR
jgi:hypothetical protein